MSPHIESPYLKAAWRRVPPSLRDQIRPFLPAAVRVTKITKVTKPPTEIPQAILPSDGKSSMVTSQETEEHMGTISVIVPVYNVEDYLVECIESIKAQSYPHLEILLINDGSTDSSAEIAERLASTDGRIRVINKKNAGLGAARNTGIALSTGEYLTFVDSDDIIPRQAYFKMVQTLHQTGSDFVVGTIRRLTDGIRRVPLWAEKLHSKPRIAITAEECPEILQDVFACNKLFRRSFWNTHVESFPENVLYEDQETTAKAYLRSQKFDVITEVVYDWRIRSDNSSITQQKERYVDVRDRLSAVHEVSRLIGAYGSETTRTAWLARTLGPDLGQYYSLIPRVSDKYWSELQQGVASLATGLTQAVLDAMSPHDRILVRLIEEGDRANAEKVVQHRAEYGNSCPLVYSSNGLFARPAYLSEIGHDPESRILRLNASDLKMKSRLFSIRKVGARSIEVSGYAFIEGLDPEHYPGVPRIELVDRFSSQRLTITSVKSLDHEVDARDGDPWVSYAGTAFSAVVNLDLLPVASHLHPEWHLAISLNVGQETIESTFQGKDAGGTTATMPLLDVTDKTRYITRFSKELGLSFFPVEQRRFVSGLEIRDQTVKLDVRAAANETLAGLRVECKALGIEIHSQPLTESGRDVTRFLFEIPQLREEETFPTDIYTYKIQVMTVDGRWHHIAWPRDESALRDTSSELNGLQGTVSGYGYLEFSQKMWRILIDDALYDATKNSFAVYYRARCITGNSGYSTLPPLVLAADSTRIEPLYTHVCHSSDTLVTHFSLSPARWGTVLKSPPPGTYTVRCATTPAGGSSKEYWIPITKDFELRLPREILTTDLRINLGRTPRAGALALQVLPPLSVSERGKYRQRVLQERIPEYMKLPLDTSAVLFESFGGKSVNDSGLELFNEMKRRGDMRTCYWSVTDKSVATPEDAVPLIRYSEEWYRRLHSAQFVVNNNNFPFYYRKRPDQTYIQTWHGTPLKRIGNDIPSNHLSLPYVKLMQREAGYWDYILAQNKFAADVLPRAFGSNAQVLTEGYPRNDVLSRIGDDVSRRELRHKLGIAEDKTVVLYAPTWRDYLKGLGNHYQMSSFLDFQQACDLLGPDFVFLVRGHSNVAGRLPALTNKQCIDVTSYDDINELYAVSDMLVTDYSSVMFDYCVTDKPIFFLAPDLIRYRDSVRGFYFDFEATSPGPIVNTTAELAAAFVDGTSEKYSIRYKEFKDRYAPYDDGSSSKRIYDKLWG